MSLGRSNLFSARDIATEPVGPVERKPFVVVAPSTPGAMPSQQGAYATQAQAEEAAIELSRGRPWLKGQDVRIQGVDGRVIVRAAGAGR